eukprot:3648460-Rhodomonas_salina.1
MTSRVAEMTAFAARVLRRSNDTSALLLPAQRLLHALSGSAFLPAYAHARPCPVLMSLLVVPESGGKAYCGDSIAGRVADKEADSVESGKGGCFYEAA